MGGGVERLLWRGMHACCVYVCVDQCFITHAGVDAARNTSRAVRWSVRHGRRRAAWQHMSNSHATHLAGNCTLCPWELSLTQLLLRRAVHRIQMLDGFRYLVVWNPGKEEGVRWRLRVLLGRPSGAQQSSRIGLQGYRNAFRLVQESTPRGAPAQPPAYVLSSAPFPPSMSPQSSSQRCTLPSIWWG